MPLNLLLLVQEGGAPAQAPASPFNSFLIPMLLVMAVFYFVMIGPERKQRKKREGMLAALKKGDKVMTQSGLYGTVGQVREDVVTLQIADGVRVRFSRAAIQTVLEAIESDSESPAASDDSTESKD